MSLTTATGLRALDVPATPTTPLGDASLGRAPQVLTQAPLGTEKKATDKLVFVDSSIGRLDLITQHYVQVYGYRASDIVPVSSWDDVKVRLAACSSIGEMCIFSHSVYSAVELNGAQRTANQIADEFAAVAPPISTLSFDGCVIGTDLVGLHAIATRLKISYVRGWTFWHYLDWWRMTPTGDPGAALAVFQPLGARASPWLPQSADGKQTISLAEQEPLFSAGTLNLAGEYFVHSLTEEVKPDFVTAVQNSTLDPAIHRTRGSAETRLIDSAGAHGAADAAIKGTPPLLARVVVTPWV
jgi:hypothetical protein